MNIDYLDTIEQEIIEEIGKGHWNNIRNDLREKAKEEVLNEVLGIISVFLTVEIQESRYYGQGESKEYQLLFELKNAIKTLSQNHSSSEGKNFNVSPDDKELPSPQTKPNLTELNSLCRDGVDKTDGLPERGREKKVAQEIFDDLYKIAYKNLDGALIVYLGETEKSKSFQLKKKWGVI